VIGRAMVDILNQEILVWQMVITMEQLVNVAQLLLIHVSLEVHLDTTQLETVHTGTVLV
jgi:hypothetical protein